MDFQQGKDKIDLTALLGAVNLAWAGKTAMANAVWYSNSGCVTTIYADTDGNAKADFKIELLDARGLKLTAGDFIGVGGSAPVASNGAAQGYEDTRSSSAGSSPPTPNGNSLQLSAWSTARRTASW